MQKRTILISAIATAALSLGALASPALADHQAGHQAGAEAASETLYSGAWTKKSFKSAGAWSIVKEGDKTYIQLDGDFKTRNAPDLKIFLSPLAASETNGKNATDGSVLIAPLASNAGAQIYEIPEGVDLSSYQSILIHCEDYAKLWSASSLG